ncbi:Transcription-repair-coupling factor [Anoxybacillus sp. BCO1]|nr:Transcription-repair-coupling factor [Anoxybacillus sp. BCO1]
MRGLRQYFMNHADMQSVAEGIRNGLKEQLVTGLSGSARSVFISSLYEETERPLCIVTHNLFQAQKIYDDLIQLVDEEEVFLYPVNELIAAELAVASPELRAQRLEVLNYWCERKKGIVIAPIAALRRLLPPKDVWERYQLHFRVGGQVDVERCLKQFVAMGYERVSVVSTPGEFSVRGGIIDIYPLLQSFLIALSYLILKLSRFGRLQLTINVR